MTVKEVGRKTKSDTTADVGKDQKEVEVFDGPAPAKDDKKGGAKDTGKGAKKEDKKDAKKSGSSAKDPAKDKKDESSSAPVKVTKEHWFYVGSLMPKFKSWGWLFNYHYPRYVNPNVYEIHIETCAETRIIYVEAFYAAHWKIEFGRASAAETKDHDDLDWNLLTPFDESVEKTTEEVGLWCDTFDSSTSGSFWAVLSKIANVFKNLFTNYKLAVSQEGPGVRLNPEISAESYEKFVKIIEAFTKLREESGQAHVGRPQRRGVPERAGAEVQVSRGLDRGQLATSRARRPPRRLAPRNCRQHHSARDRVRSDGRRVAVLDRPSGTERLGAS